MPQFRTLLHLHYRLIAVMLGRLRLSIEECKNAYTNLARNAFTPKNWASSTAAKVTLGPKFKTAPLEEAIKSLIGDNADAELLKENNPACKVCVSVTLDSRLDLTDCAP